MTESVEDLVVLPPVADDPVFLDELTSPGAYPARGPLGSDPHDFAALFIKHKWSFALHARRFLSDQRDVDEVVQEGFLKLFLALPELESELQVLAYARRTITNLCIDRYRADQRRPRLVDLESLPVDVLSDEDDIDPLVAAEDAAIVREALALLSPLHRHALIKREVEEKSIPEIAAELDVPVEQVKHLLHRARRSLRRLLVGTHVEPGVDLDLATVIAANRIRAAAAAKPTGAAALAFVLMLGAVLGLRARSAPDHVEGGGALPASPGVVGLLPGPPPDSAKPTSPAKTAGAPTTSRSGATPRPPKLLSPQRDRGHEPMPGSGSSPMTDSPASSPTPVSAEPMPVTGGGTATHPHAPFTLRGDLIAAQASVRDMQRQVVHVGGGQTGTYVTSGLFAADTTSGSFAMDQRLVIEISQAGPVSVRAAMLEATVPAATGSQQYSVTLPSVVSSPTPEGGIGLRLQGTLSPHDASAAGGFPGTVSFDVRIQLAPDLTRVLTESVDLSLGGASFPSTDPPPPPSSATGSPTVGGSQEAGATAAPTATLPPSEETLPESQGDPAAGPSSMHTAGMDQNRSDPTSIQSPLGDLAVEGVGAA